MTFLTISGFAIHGWRVDHWRLFDQLFTNDAALALGQPASPLWLYAVAFPFVAINFGCTVAILVGVRRHMVPLFTGSALVIAGMPLIGQQQALYRMIWPDILTMLGYATAGAIVTILTLRLDSVSQARSASPGK